MIAQEAKTFGESGREWRRDALLDVDLIGLERTCAMGNAPGARVAARDEIRIALEPVNLLARMLLPGAIPVRVVAFNKSETENWALPWHQDRVIAVKERIEVPGYSNWTRKAGVWHVEPPIEVLERMMFARVHLDVATPDNGALELACGTHALGRVADADVPRHITDNGQEPELCLAKRGDILFAAALTLHRSRASRSSAARRAVRIDYSADHLPAPLEWEFSP